MSDIDRISGALAALPPDEREETEALLKLGRYVADRGYERLRDLTLATAPEYTPSGPEDFWLPDNRWITPNDDAAENDLMLDAIVASALAYWDDDPSPCIHVRVERRSNRDRRSGDHRC
ncbi:MAG: hypothetical protein ACYC91_19810 [Solirubrobacteraceae bacterium]